MATAAGIAIAGGVAQNGAVVDLWLASRFSGTPAYNAAPPAGSPDYGPTTSGTVAGAPGEWQIPGVAHGDFYVRMVSAGNTYYSGPFAISADSDVVHIGGAETISGLKTFSGGLTVSGGVVTLPAGTVSMAGLTGTLPVANGGTGSATQNFVDITTPQTIGGIKTFSAVPVFSAGFTVSPGGVITLPNASIPFAAVIGLAGGSAGVDLGTSQIVTGQKTFDNDVPVVGGQILASAISTPSAPVVTPTGTAGSTTYQYRIVAVTYDGRDSINSATGQTTTGNATLSGTNFNALSWSAVTAAASYKVLKFVSGSWQLLAGNIAATTYNDTGVATPSAYTLITLAPGGEIAGTSATFSRAVTTATVAANAGVGGVVSGRFIGVVPAAGPAAPYVGAVGDFGIDVNSRQWVCITAGTPGTWVPVNAGGFISGGYAEVLTSQASISTEVAITGLSITITAASGRRIMVTQQTFPGNGSVGNQVITANIKEGVTMLMQSNCTLSFSGGNQTLHSAVVLTPTAAVHTYFVSMSAGSGTFTNAASSTFRSFILAQDLGPNI